jgi:thymidylate kinase
VPNTIGELWRPHVVIYLDKPAEECLKTIKQKGKVNYFTKNFYFLF